MFCCVDFAGGWQSGKGVPLLHCKVSPTPSRNHLVQRSTFFCVDLRCTPLVPCLPDSARMRGVHPSCVFFFHIHGIRQFFVYSHYPPSIGTAICGCVTGSFALEASILMVSFLTMVFASFVAVSLCPPPQIVPAIRGRVSDIFSLELTAPAAPTVSVGTELVLASFFCSVSVTSLMSASHACMCVCVFPF